MLEFRAAALAAGFIVMAGPALSAPSTLQLIVGGEAYDGAPRLEVSFDGKVLGQAVVSAAIDTVGTGRFADAADKSAYVQSFDFTVPEDVFKPGGVVRVRFLNEAYGGDGSNHDRNLYLAAVAVNGRAVTLSGLSTQGTSASTANETLGEFLVLRDGNVEAVSRPPAGGWPLPGADTAAVTPAATKPPAIVAKVEAAPAAAPAPATEAAAEEVASVATPAGGTDCARDELYNVIGFNENSNDLTPKLMQRLDQIAADIGSQTCKVQVTGYSSRQGDHATNALFAVERAQNVLAYLKQKGLDFAAASAAGGGATDQFGADFAANRRVVITVRP
jgi:outer membrane protein OmpA-like peptidoglycan-associated protein